MQHGIWSSPFIHLFLPRPCARIIRLTRVDFAFHVIKGARGFGFQAGNLHGQSIPSSSWWYRSLLHTSSSDDRRVQGGVEYISLPSTAPYHRHHLRLQLIEQNREYFDVSKRSVIFVRYKTRNAHSPPTEFKKLIKSSSFCVSASIVTGTTDPLIFCPLAPVSIFFFFLTSTRLGWVTFIEPNIAAASNMSSSAARSCFSTSRLRLACFLAFCLSALRSSGLRFGLLGNKALSAGVKSARGFIRGNVDPEDVALGA